MNYKQLPKYILLPVSKLYGMGVELRNRLFDWGILKQQSFDIPIVVVGNIAVGGTGKTPHTEYIIDQLIDKYNIGVISRGYKRKTKGFILATNHSTPKEIGDEPYQIFHKFNGKISVAVCENRCKGIKTLLSINREINLILLDDAFQHRYVKPSISILLTEFGRPLFYDKLLPYGNLREPISALSRTDMVVVTKCPDYIKPMDMRIFTNNLITYPYQHISFSHYVYGQLLPLFPEKVKSIPYLDWLSSEDVLFAVSGIGNPRPFVKQLKKYNAKVKVTAFQDHCDFSKHDIDIILKRFKSFEFNNKYIVVTEKDAVKIINLLNFPEELKPYIFYLPIKVGFHDIQGNKSFIEVLIEGIEGRRKIIK
ncbi:MAG: tetraacyldisaccharide 4'-kinase [Bacteroidales bacterium]|nr:tetraacyldisaccharide 4'-kinase [Bacteroidales bacterium]